MSNYPDDWNSHHIKCWNCGNHFHNSEYGCSCLDDHLEESIPYEFSDQKKIDDLKKQILKLEVENEYLRKCINKEDLISRLDTVLKNLS